VITAADASKRGGADQITIHLREDRRHIQDHDLKDLMKWGRLPINLEMGMTAEMVSIAKRSRPFSVTLVPERRAEMTTESGLDLKKLKSFLTQIRDLKRRTRIYSFIDPDIEQVQLSSRFELKGVEFHTGPFSHAFLSRHSPQGKKNLKIEIDRLVRAASLAANLGLEVKAGHGLTLENVGLLKKIPALIELNIGHSIVARSVFVGLEKAVREMKRAIQ
jgi:pyridoxine 5-phosphate synthase